MIPVFRIYAICNDVMIEFDKSIPDDVKIRLFNILNNKCQFQKFIYEVLNENTLLYLRNCIMAELTIMVNNNNLIYYLDHWIIKENNNEY